MITYLCGGINGLGNSECMDWRELAKSLLITSTLDPMRRDYRGNETEAHREIVDGDLADISQSDFILVNATRPSWGTAMEIVYANDMAKTVVAFVGAGRVSPWLRFHCALIETLLEDAVDHINSLVIG